MELKVNVAQDENQQRYADIIQEAQLALQHLGDSYRLVSDEAKPFIESAIHHIHEVIGLAHLSSS